MTHVVSENCIKCKHTDCVDVCPVDCFRETPIMLIIDPDECIDCAVCVPECPVNAIYAEEDLPRNQREFIKINANYSRSSESQPITHRKQPLECAMQWANIENKRRILLGNFDEKLSPSDLENKLKIDLTSDDIDIRSLSIACIDQLSATDIERILNDSDCKAREALIRRNDFNPNAEQIGRIIIESSEIVRLALFESKTIVFSSEQIECGLIDDSVRVRCAVLRRNFVPTFEQFLRHIVSTESRESELMWNKLNRQIFDEIISQSNNELIVMAVRKLDSPLLESDINSLLLSNSKDVQLEIIDRLICRTSTAKLSSNQIDQCLAHSNDERRAKFLEKYRDQLTIGQFEKCLQDTFKNVREIVIGSKKHKLTADQIERALNDQSDKVRIAILKKKKISLSAEQVDRMLNDESINVRLNVVSNPNIQLSSDQIDLILKDIDEIIIRTILRKDVTLTFRQSNYIDKHCSTQVRLKLLECKGFTPTSKQIICGLSDNDTTIRIAYRRFLSLLNDDELLKHHIPGYNAATRTFDDPIGQTLSEMQSLAGWTARKITLKERLIEQVKAEGYVVFRTAGRTALVSKVGESCIYDVPVKKTGGLSRFAGKRVRLICIGHERYSTVVLASHEFDSSIPVLQETP